MNDTDLWHDLWIGEPESTVHDTVKLQYGNLVVVDSNTYNSSQIHTASCNTLDEQDATQAKKEERKRKNCISAKLSRLRQKEKMENLDRKVAQESHKVCEQAKFIANLQKENALLTEEIRALHEKIAEMETRLTTQN